MRPFVLLLAIAVLCAGTACSDPSTRGGLRDAQTAARSAPATPPDSSVKTQSKPRIVFLGDSLTAGLNLPAAESYPALLQRKLDAKGYRYEVVNAGVSGDTSAGGLRRLDWSLDGDVKILVVALGANDGLRGLSPQDLKSNLATILDRAVQKGITVILAGMEAPPNYGPDYTRQFRGVYTELAKKYKVRFLPFLLQGVAGISALNQADGVHPNARGAQIIADLVWGALDPVLERQPAVSP